MYQIHRLINDSENQKDRPHLRAAPNLPGQSNYRRGAGKVEHEKGPRDLEALLMCAAHSKLSAGCGENIIDRATWRKQAINFGLGDVKARSDPLGLNAFIGAPIG